MTAQTISAAQPGAGPGDGPRGGFGAALRAEWTKFRSVRGWVIGMILAALLTVLFGAFVASNVGVGCEVSGGPLQTGKACLPYVPHGPGGTVVTDTFSFVHKPLTGNGTITARVTALTGQYANPGAGPARAGHSSMVPGLVGWAKAGIILMQSTRQGSAYAAMMVTGSHGARLQYNYTGDIAGAPGSVSAVHPRWLRLTRSGGTITGYDSADGTHWTRVAAVQLAGLPPTVQAGLFAASPDRIVVQGGGTTDTPAQATGVFDHVSLTGASPGAWAGTKVAPPDVGPPRPPPGQGPAPYTRSGSTFAVTGSGDIAPVPPGPGGALPTVTIEQSLAGVFLGLILIVTVAAMFAGTEYRSGLIRTTLAATPRRGAVLAAKSVVIGAAAFAAGLAGALGSILIGVPKEENQGLAVLTVPAATEVRVIAGTAAMLALLAVFALALGVILRRSAAAITIAVVIVVMSFLVGVAHAGLGGAGGWLLRLTPAAGLSIEQSIPRYPQLTTVTAPGAGGYYPLSPYAGFAVLCLWTAAALALALVMLRRRDA